jgi:hypothetical protein
VVALLASAALGSLLTLLLRAQLRLRGANAALQAVASERAVALAGSERMLGEALDAGSFVAWQLDIPTGQVRRSGGAAGLLGLAHRRRGGRLPVPHPSRGPRRRRRGPARGLRGEAPYDVEYRFRGADGRDLWLADRATVERDAAGQPLRFTGILQDVSARRQADAERAEREARDRYLLALEDALRAAPGARDAVQAACEMIGRRLGVAVAGVAEVERMAGTPWWKANGGPARALPFAAARTSTPSARPITRCCCGARRP